ncbi:MAG: SDR family NAD(P)-dependent oxidoreductase [Gammaproteobacteria bacterium]|nr:SDR family NAD(P)-dependent oxidoreductase [Gammaproteobacteria bacterium]MDH3407508.1 SDR family NAD(P)-dependent oxidoreductase [Gammaproteobacteria bacterium]MDH3563921.1 SDR family NAD(P)-dependent oxidoreductase [Gammaproteobacteria bacterium]MDH5488238.1 SDR family NAD(P)-dependent oxidoreductase [Gammaproteobacteria bacterium]
MTNTEPRAVLISGCSTGIGRCVAHGLRRRGYRVFASARRQADVENLSAAGFESLPLDLDSSDSIRTAVATVLERTGSRLYALVNNGAYGQPGAVEDLSREVLRAQFETNLFGTQELTNLVIPAMRAQEEGRIINISSILGIVCFAYRGAYNATKFALEALSDTMRLELRGTNIYVSLIEPGPIESRFRANAYEAFKRHIDREHSAHREYYARVEKRLEGTKPMPFTLPPEAVLKKVICALEARRPKARYGVTFPTHLFLVLRRVLPTRVLDAILKAISIGGQR